MSASMPDPTLEESLSLLRRGFDLALQSVAAQYVLPICWVTSINGQPVIPGSGSAFVMEAEECAFAVSCGPQIFDHAAADAKEYS